MFVQMTIFFVQLIDTIITCIWGCKNWKARWKQKKENPEDVIKIGEHDEVAFDQWYTNTEQNLKSFISMGGKKFED